MKKILILLITFLIGGNRAIAYSDIIKKNENIDQVVLDLDGSTTAKIETSQDVFSITNISVKGLELDPFLIEVVGKTLILKQKDPQQKTTSFQTSYNLTIPYGTDVKIISGNADFSGSVELKSLSIQSGNLKMKMNLVIDRSLSLEIGNGDLDLDVYRAKKVSLFAGNVNGKMAIPVGAAGPKVPFWSKLKVIKKN